MLMESHLVSLKYNHFGVPSVYRGPSRTRSPLWRVAPPLERAINRVRWIVLRHRLRQISGPLINPHRVAMGLPSLDEPLVLDSNSEQLALFAVSRYVACPPPDWPTRYYVTGYFFPQYPDWVPDPALVDFLTAGEPPVVFTFGSMVHNDPRALTALILAAIERAGCRALIQRGWSGLALQQLPAHVLAIDFVPYAWLFPHVACVVQHGGAGTVAEAFRASIPSVFVPHLVDQPLWAALARQLGCAGPTVPFRRLTAERLAAAIITTLADPRLRRSAAELGKLIHSEHGVQTACHLVESFGRGMPPMAAGPRLEALDGSIPDHLPIWR